MKKILYSLVIAITLLTLSACLPQDYYENSPDLDFEMPETIDELYSYYNEVSRGMTKNEISELFGEGEANTDIDINGRFIKYINDKQTAGVIIEYTSDELIRAKTLFFNSKKVLSEFSPQFDSSLLHKIKDNMPLAEALEILGDNPLEISCEYSLNDPVGVSNIFAWYNKDGRSYHLYSENGVIKNRVLYGSEN